MGIYFNPSNDSFTKDKNSELYLDKTGLLEYLNRVICTNTNFDTYNSLTPNWYYKVLR